MQLNPVASTVLVILYVVATVLLIALLGALVFAVQKLNTTLETVTARIDPMLAKVDSLLTATSEKVDAIGGKTEAILGEGEATAEAVRGRVERTAAVVQETVNRPLIGVNALAAGMARGMATFAALQRGVRSDMPGNAADSGRVELNGSLVSQGEPAVASMSEHKIAVPAGAAAIGNDASKTKDIT